MAEAQLLSFILSLIRIQRLRGKVMKRKETKWSREWLLKRSQYSHVLLLKELRGEPDDWRNYLRMDTSAYSQLLELVTPYIQKEDTCMRKAISPHERLTATLRYLATGRSLKDLEFTTIISKPALSKIIPETCDAIYLVLKKNYLKFLEKSKAWLDIASAFEKKWQFPHCLGAIDGKHIQIVPPKNSGSYYYNYKKTHSIVLMAIANANCEFIYCSVGTNGRVSDGGVINNTTFHEKLICNELKIPEPAKVSNSDRVLEYVFVGDEAFAMRPDLIKPYNRESLNRNRRIFNYRLSRARRVVENAFGIFASRFRIFRTPIHLKVENIEKVVLACTVLHNFLRRNSPDHYTPPGTLDSEDIVNNEVQLGERCDPEMVHNLQRGRRGQVLHCAKAIRDKFTEYFNQEGAVPWQDNMISLQPHNQ